MCRFIFPPRRRPLSNSWSITIDGALNEARTKPSPPPVSPVKSVLDSAEERASKAEAEHRQTQAQVASLKLELAAAEAAVVQVRASCEEKIKKYDADLIYSGQTAGSLRRQLSDAVEEKARAVAAAEQASQQEQTYRTAISNLQSSIESAQKRNDTLQLEMKLTKEELSNVIQSMNQSAALSTSRIAELDSALSQASATVKEQAGVISMLQTECRMKEESLASAAANITSWTELCAGLKRQIDDVRISESCAREACRVEVEAAVSQVKIAEDLVLQVQTECCAALKARADADASAAAQAKSDSSALKRAEAQAREHDDIVSSLRKELESLKDVQSRLQAESIARVVLEKKCAAAEACASAAVSEERAKSSECESLKAQLDRAIQSANASASIKDSLKDQIENLSAQLLRVGQDNHAKTSALQTECDSLKEKLAEAFLREKEQSATNDALKFQLAKLTCTDFQEREEITSLKSLLDESNSQTTQLKEHMDALREHVAKAAHARVIQEEAYTALSHELEALQNENRELKSKVTAFSLEQMTNTGLKAQIKRLEDDKKTLQGHVDSLMESTRLALQADSALAAAQAQLEPSIEAARRYKSLVDEMRIRLDEAMEATAALVTQAEDSSIENASLKEQVVILKEHVRAIIYLINYRISRLLLRLCSCPLERQLPRMPCSTFLAS